VSTAVEAILATWTTAIHLGGSNQGNAHPWQEDECAENRTPFEPALMPIPYHNEPLAKFEKVAVKMEQR
jgi:hypothetical protein